MALCQTKRAHPALRGLESAARLRYFELCDARGVYGAGAWAEHPDCLELHLELLRFGPATVRSMRKDLRELEALARGLGKGRIVGLRTEPGTVPDARWPKFTRLFGFTGQRLFQTAELHLD